MLQESSVNIVDNPVAEHAAGTHILAELFDCAENRDHMLNVELLEALCRQAVADSGLTQVGSKFYQFPGAGVTGVVLLAESHMAIHTWPEKDYLTLDVFVCNITRDNTDRARALYENVVRLFQPGRTNCQEIERN